ncbi:MAG: tetratricopeptide repeat protein [Cytophagales bacterium]|nr:tetratricopeptide repeat protein [Cytophagales bacterium]
MKNTLIIVLIAFYSLSSMRVYSSDPPVEALWKHVLQHYNSKQLDSALHYAYQLEQIAIKKGKDRYLPKAKLIIAKVNEKRNERESVLLFYDLLDISERLDDHRVMGTANLNLGQIFTRAYEYDDALNHLKEAYLQYGLAKEPDNQSAALYEIARSYLNRNMPDSAKPYLVKALELNPPQYPGHTSKIFNNLGQCAFQMGKYSLARYYYLRALRYVEHTNTKKYGIAYNNVGESYFFEGKMDEAEYWLDMALILKKSFGKPSLTLSTLVLLAKTYQQQGNIASAVMLLNEGLMAVDGDDVNANTMEALRLVTELDKNHAKVSLPPSLLNRYVAMTNYQNLALIKQKDILSQSSARYALQVTVKEYFNQKEQVELQSKVARNGSLAVAVATFLVVAIYFFIKRNKRLKLESNNLVQDSMQKLRDATLEKLISQADYEAIRRKLRLRGDGDV